MEERVKTAALLTFGCKVNQTESAFLAQELERCGYRVTYAFPQEPVDLAVVNGCVVTSKAEAQSRRAVLRIHRVSPHALIVVTGCLGELRPEDTACLPGVRLVLGNEEKETFSDFIEHMQPEGPARTHVGGVRTCRRFPDRGTAPFAHRTRAYLKVQDGCDSFCAYCIVPHTRGRRRSLDPAAVLRQLRALSHEGFQEVVLTGIHLGQYGQDLVPESSLLDLLERIDREEPVPRIRLSSIEPQELSPDLIRLAARSRCLACHFHIPLQSGDPDILKRMNRRYTPEEYADLVHAVRSELPRAAIGADVMVGFPGETDPRFERTRSLIERLPLSYLHVFAYSRRSGTPASSMSGQIAPRVKRERSAELMDLGHRKRLAFYRSWIGRSTRLLVEQGSDSENGSVTGFTDEYVPVWVPGDHRMRNRLVPVRITRMHGEKVYGYVPGRTDPLGL